MTEPRVQIVLVEDAPRRAEAFAIRFEVFVDEQGVDRDVEIDDLDEDAQHLLVTVAGRPVATGRLVTEPAGYEGVAPALGPVAHLGRIAVLAPHRGTGLGSVVVRSLEDLARARRLRPAYLSAQVVALRFYERLGYAAHGPEYLDENIPHRHMTRLL